MTLVLIILSYCSSICCCYLQMLIADAITFTSWCWCWHTGLKSICLLLYLFFFLNISDLIFWLLCKSFNIKIHEQSSPWYSLKYKRSVIMWWGGVSGVSPFLSSSDQWMFYCVNGWLRRWLFLSWSYYIAQVLVVVLISPNFLLDIARLEWRDFN